MTIRQSILFIVFVGFLNPIAVRADNVAWSPAQETMPFKQLWSGTALPNELLSAAPTSSYIADAASWAKLWHAWRGDERLPEVDFDKESIVFCTAISPNTCGVNVSVNQYGVLKVAPVRTLIASDAKTFNYQIGLIEREKIRSIEWTAIAPEWNPGICQIKYRLVAMAVTQVQLDHAKVSTDSAVLMKLESTVCSL